MPKTIVVTLSQKGKIVSPATIDPGQNLKVS